MRRNGKVPVNNFEIFVAYNHNLTAVTFTTAIRFKTGPGPKGTKRMAEILIVEDEPAINDLMAMNLKLVGHHCTQIFNGRAAAEYMQSHHPDLVLLDVMLPGQDGFALLKNRSFDGIPVIMVTARIQVNDRVKGLNLGADDYIIKPFAAPELLARVEAVLRRSLRSSQEFILDNTVVNLQYRTVTVDSQEVELTNQEFELLAILIQNRNLALSRDKMLTLAWGYDYMGDTRTVDVHITRLRKKLHWENRIKTIFKVGYRLEVPLCASGKKS